MSSLVSKPVVGALPHMLRDVAFNLALSVSSEAAAFDKHGFLAGFYFKHQVVTQKKRSQQQLKSLQFFLKRTNRFTSPSIFRSKKQDIIRKNLLQTIFKPKFLAGYVVGDVAGSTAICDVPHAGKRSAVPAAKLLALPSPATEKAADLW